MTLGELNTGEQGKIVNIEGRGALRRRLMDMGLTPGTIVYVRKVAPLGDPVELHLRGYELTLRREDASNIGIVKLVKADERPPHHRGRFGRRFWGGRR